MEHNRQFFLILDHFLPFYMPLFPPPAHAPPAPSNNLENQNFEKMKKHPGDIILPMCTTNDIWLLRYKIHQTQFFIILGQLLPFYPPPSPLTAWKMKISKTWEKTPGDIIILHKCNKNCNHWLYCSWDMTRDRCNYFLFWDILFPFTPLTANSPKNKHFKKWKKRLDISFNMSVPKSTIICYTVPEIWHVMDVIDIFHFEQFFALLHPALSPVLTTRQKSSKKWKKTPGDIII